MLSVNHSTMGKHFAACIGILWVLAVLVGAASQPAHAQDSGEIALRGELELNGGGSITGQLLGTKDPEIVRWQGDAFSEPFEFPLQTIYQLTLQTTGEPTSPTDEFACELRHGDRIYGKLVDLTERDVVLHTAIGQRLRIDRAQIQALARGTPQLREHHSGSARSNKRRSIDDPGRISAWRLDANGVTHAWALGKRLKPLERQRMNDPFGAPNPVPDQAPARINQRIKEQLEQHMKQLEQELIQERGTKSGYFVDLELAPQCMLELELAWKKPLQFELALGIEHDHESLQRSVRLAVWDGSLVLVRELDSELTLIPVVPADQLAAQQELRLMIYLDRLGRRTQVRSTSGQVLAEYVAMENQPQAGRGVRLFAGEGTRVDRLWATAFSWDSLTSIVSPHDVPGAVLRSGEAIEGMLGQLDAATQTLSIKQRNTMRQIALDQIHHLVVTPVDAETDGGTADAPASMPSHRAATFDGWSLQGQLLAITADAARLQVHGIRESVEVPLSRLTSLSSIDRQPQRAPDRTAQLITAGTQLPGKIAQSDPEAAQPQFRFHAQDSLTAAALRPAVTGEIAYRVRPQFTAATENRVIVEPQPPAGGLGGALFQIFAGPQPVRRIDPAVLPRRGTALQQSRQGTLFLRTGDTVDCEVTRIDEHGVTFTSVATGEGFARHDQVKSVILAGLTQPKHISKATRDRLLMVPRARRDDPPTHLICSRSGDFLRGRLLGLSDESLQMEVRLDSRVIPRDRVAQIFWLHPDEIGEAASDDAATSEAEGTIPPASTQPSGDTLANDALVDAPPADDAAADDAAADTVPAQAAQLWRVQAVRLDGTRMTFNYLGCRDESTLVGHHEVLGPCGVEVTQLDRLLIGGAIDQSINESPLALWRLYHAPIPKAFLPGAGGAEGASGTESALVGKPAPQFELQLHDGQRFRLADSRGKVVVLDFWASWCGPCIGAMPQIEAVVSEFAAEDVRLVAVNLQETPETISGALQRMGLDVTVAMDRNGAVAEQYGVTAIPQTVIIGPDGDVARLYVGVNSSFAQQMRTAITELLQPNQSAAAP